MSDKRIVLVVGIGTSPVMMGEGLKMATGLKYEITLKDGAKMSLIVSASRSTDVSA